MSDTFTNPGQLARARVAGSHARRQRYLYLEAITAGEVTLTDTIRAACTPAGKALLSLTLQSVLKAQPGWSNHRVKTVLTAFATVAEADVPSWRAHKGLTIGWLVDPRSRGRRLAAWASILTPPRLAGQQIPVPAGFPYRNIAIPEGGTR